MPAAFLCVADACRWGAVADGERDAGAFVAGGDGADLLAPPPGSVGCGPGGCCGCCGTGAGRRGFGGPSRGHGLVAQYVVDQGGCFGLYLLEVVGALEGFGVDLVCVHGGECTGVSPFPLFSAFCTFIRFMRFSRF